MDDVQTLALHVGDAGDTDPETARIQWRLIGSNAAMFQPVTQTCLGRELSATVTGRVARVICIIPTDWTVITSLYLPAIRKSLLQATVQYAVEDLLIQPIDQYHVATIGQSSDNTITLAIIEHELMLTWCDWLDSMFGSVKNQLVVDGWLLPPSHRPLLATGINERVLISVDDETTYACSAGDEALFVEALRADGGHVDSASQLDTVQQKHEHISTHALLIAAGTYAGPDLRQGRYRAPVLWGWRMSLITLGVGLSLSLLILSAFNFYQASAYSITRKSFAVTATELYQDVFPSDGQIVDIPAQARQHLNLLKQRAASQPALDVFPEYFAQVALQLTDWMKDRDATVEGISYRADTVTFEVLVSAVNMQHLTDLESRLGTIALDAKLVSAASTDKNRFNGRFILKYNAQ